MHLGQNYHNIMLFVILNNSPIETTLNITPQLHLSLLEEDLAAYYDYHQIQSNLNFIKFGILQVTLHSETVRCKVKQ